MTATKNKNREHIDIFDDRIEITSPGGMVSRKEIQNLDLMSIPFIGII